MEEEIEKTIEVLKSGGVILYPTDTVWGLGCDATNPDAIKRIDEIKKRAEGKHYIVLLDDDRKLNKYVQHVPDLAWDLVEYASKPTTIIYPQAANLPDEVVAENGSIAIRIVNEGFCNKLIRKYNKPLVSTSANISNQPNPSNLTDIDSSILDAVDYVVNLPAKSTNKPSVIIRLEKNGEIEFIRK